MMMERNPQVPVCMGIPIMTKYLPRHDKGHASISNCLVNHLCANARFVVLTAKCS